LLFLEILLGGVSAWPDGRLARFSTVEAVTQSQRQKIKRSVTLPSSNVEICIFTMLVSGVEVLPRRKQPGVPDRRRSRLVAEQILGHSLRPDDRSPRDKTGSIR